MQRIIYITLWVILCLPGQICWGQQQTNKPNVRILATGGTIAGTGKAASGSSYEPGKVSIESLLAAVPQLNDLANVTGEQIVNIGSEHMTNQVMLELAKRVNQLMEDDSIDGIVITHGTDTMEETAFFLSLTTRGKKPVVLTGAMRPSTSLSSDGSLNLYNAVMAAVAPQSKHRGVLVAMNGSLYAAKNVIKTHTLNPESFQASYQGEIGYIDNAVIYYEPAKETENKLFFEVSQLSLLPKVGIVYGHSDIQPDMIEGMLQNGYKGIVYAGVGNGNIHNNVLPTLVKAAEDGIKVVRAARTTFGPVTINETTYEQPYPFVASNHLNPQKSRILLMLALVYTDDYKQIRKYFSNF